MTRVPPTSRVSFPPGGTLAARDLAADREAEAVRRALHVRVVHDTWGIALGLDVSAVVGGRVVTVSPGLAHDRAGRERWVGEPTTLVVPDRLGTASVVLTLAAGEDRPDCPGGAPGRAALRWRPPRAVPTGEVPLALVDLDDGAVSAIDLGVRRSLRGLPARMVAGVQDVDLPVASLLFTRIRIDAPIRGAGGTTRWFATLADRSAAGLAALPVPVWAWLRGPYLNVREESEGGFSLDIRFAVREDAFAVGLLDGPGVPASLALAVEWVGVRTPTTAP